MVGKLRIRNIKELQEPKYTELVTVNNTRNVLAEQQTLEVIDLIDVESEEEEERKTPKTKTKIRKTQRRTAAKTTSKKNRPNSVQTTATTIKRKVSVARTAKKQVSAPNQSRIDNFFKSCSKTFKVEADLMHTPEKTLGSGVKKKGNINGSGRRAKGRKRLFEDNAETETTVTPTTITCITTAGKSSPTRSKQQFKMKRTITENVLQTKENTNIIHIDLSFESDEELHILPAASDLSERGKANENTLAERLTVGNSASSEFPPQCTPLEILLPPTPINTNTIYCDSKTSLRNEQPETIPSNCSDVVAPSTSAQKGRKTKTAPRQCPSYKVVAGTTFAVDAFQYKPIKDVTHYFLTHFHADHYVGLTRSFAMPIYLSSITAKLVRTFIPVDEKYLHELPMYEPQVVEGVEVTAIDANHCPGAIMLIFKLSTGKCHLHTGDFRACAEMESEPVFWNNDIDTIYLDTTYISDSYAFRTQHESIDEAKMKIREFYQKHSGKRILFVCGAYLIGKERFWSALAEEFGFFVWTEEKRLKALTAMQIPEYQKLICDNPRKANFHVISIGKLGYLSLLEYFEPYSNDFDLLLAIRPSGWEKNSRPQFRGKINIIGIEYSEHSSHDELQRFVMYIKPKHVISTVPVEVRNPMNTAHVPHKWYKYKKLTGMQRNFQPSITSYLKLNARKTLATTNNNKQTSVAVAATATTTATTSTKLSSPQAVVKSIRFETPNNKKSTSKGNRSNKKSSPLDVSTGSLIMNYDEEMAIVDVSQRIDVRENNENFPVNHISNIPASDTHAHAKVPKLRNIIIGDAATTALDADDDWLS